MKDRSKTYAKVLGYCGVKPTLILRCLQAAMTSPNCANPKFGKKARNFVEIHDVDHEIS